MEKAEQSFSVKDAVYKLQLSLLDGIHQENLLFSAGSLMSRSDYEDVVIERSNSGCCGYPLCQDSLPSVRPRKGRYRIALKEHKVYDLQETYKFCSTPCLVNSRAFSSSLKNERCSSSDPIKIQKLLRLFEDSGFREANDCDKVRELGFHNLRIQEKEDMKDSEKSIEKWIGPSNAIEGYIPQRDRIVGNSQSQSPKKGSKLKFANSKGKLNVASNELDFTSTIIIGDPHSNSKAIALGDNQKRHMDTRNQNTHGYSDVGTIDKHEKSITLADMNQMEKQSGASASSATKKNDTNLEEGTSHKQTILKSSLKSSRSKSLTHRVTWADKKKVDNSTNGILCDIRQINGISENQDISCSYEPKFNTSNSQCISSKEDAENSTQWIDDDHKKIDSMLSDGLDDKDEHSLHVVSAEASIDAIAVIVSGKFDACDSDCIGVKHTDLDKPIKPLEVLNSDDSWHSKPPDGFCLTLSTFATMWNALFGWLTSSSLAYIYGQDDGHRDEFSIVNGREYPLKIVLSDGRSSEIKKTLAGCISRILPGVLSELKLPTPVSTLEKAMVCLLDTMSFADALPPFRLKQWHVIVVLFIDALSVHRIPSLSSHMATRRMLLNKILDAAKISIQEYQIMKDLLIPLGELSVPT